MPETLKVVVHGGVGSPMRYVEGCVAAAEIAMARLQAGDSALQGALAGAVVLEDDERFNAGTGSSLRMDGVTIEMDAAVMDSLGTLGAVAGIQRVKNPVLVAQAVSLTPHWLLAGTGATAFARLNGFEDYYQVTPRARARWEKIMRLLFDADTPNFEAAWKTFDFRKFWNFERHWQEVIDTFGSSTIGVVTRDRNGQFAVCNSTGGSSPMLFGRVGDTPIIGCGYYAGPYGAIAATGIGEHIVSHMLCKTVYDWLAAGAGLQEALARGIALFPADIEVGLIGVSRDAAAFAANRDMAAFVLEE